MFRLFQIGVLFLFMGWGVSFAQGTATVLPKLYDSTPDQLYRLLGRVGAGAKTLLEARNQLQREALKVSADAVVVVRCQEGGIKRTGLTFAKVQPYCRGMAVKFIEEDKP